MIQPKAYGCLLTFLWILSLQGQNSKEPTKKTPAFQHYIQKKVIFAGVYGCLQKYCLVILGKWQTLLKVTGLYLDFVKLGFIGSVSFIC